MHITTQTCRPVTHDDPVGAIIVPQTAEGHAFMREALAGLAAGARPLRSPLERARLARANAVFLYGEARVLECEAAGYACPTSRRYSLRMTDAELAAAAEMAVAS